LNVVFHHDHDNLSFNHPELWQASSGEEVLIPFIAWNGRSAGRDAHRLYATGPLQDGGIPEISFRGLTFKILGPKIL